MAQVITAVELEDDQYASMQKVAAVTQKNVMLETQIDPSILGGSLCRSTIPFSMAVSVAACSGCAGNS